MAIKTLKSIDISSVTVMTTAINIIFSLIVSIILAVFIGIVTPAYIAPALLLIPAIISATIIVSVYKTFIEGFIYNLVASKTPISFMLEDDGTVSKISTTSTAIVIAIITTVIMILELLIAMIVLPLALSSLIQTLMISGLTNLGYGLYQALMLISNPGFIIGIIIGGFIITFIYVLIATYIYNYIASKDYGFKLTIIDNSILESIDVKSFAIAIATVSLVLGLISGIVNALSTGQYISIIASVISNFVVGFIVAGIISKLYNVFGPKIGKIKFKLIDE